LQPFLPLQPLPLTDGERLFQAGCFVTEMQYQHLVFEDLCARAVRPSTCSFSGIARF
jgi:hypothetical protein